MSEQERARFCACMLLLLLYRTLMRERGVQVFHTHPPVGVSHRNGFFFRCSESGSSRQPWYIPLYTSLFSYLCSSRSIPHLY